MKDEIKNIFSKILQLDSQDLEIFIDKFSPLHLKKGEFFIQEGKRCTKIGFILKGCLVCAYNNDGVEVIDEFAIENEFITDYLSLLNNNPAEKNVKCLEDSDLIVIDSKDLNQLYNQKHSFERVGRIIAESLFKNWHQKAVSLMLDDAETRYKKLVKNKQSILQRVPQYLIASYLGITPESLSRIRKKITL